MQIDPWWWWWWCRLKIFTYTNFIFYSSECLLITPFPWSPPLTHTHPPKMKSSQPRAKRFCEVSGVVSLGDEILLLLLCYSSPSSSHCSSSSPLFVFPFLPLCHFLVFLWSLFLMLHVLLCCMVGCLRICLCCLSVCLLWTGYAVVEGCFGAVWWWAVRWLAVMWWWVIGS